jgi:acetyltransferase-like isoleucine patch superfamily enzyme
VTRFIHRIARRLQSGWHHLRVRTFLHRRVTGRIKLRGDSSRLRIDPTFRCDGDLWLGVYAGAGEIVPNVSASGPLTITAVSLLRIGAGTLFGPNVFVTDHYHGDRRDVGHMALAPSNRPLHSPGSVEIERDVLVGANAVILAPARVRQRAIIAANVVVKGDVMADSVYTGLHRASAAHD